MADYYVPQELRRYLVAQNIVRYPHQSNSKPVCYVDHPDGPPAPSDAEPVIVHLSDSGGIPQDPLEQWNEQKSVDVHIRALAFDAGSSTHQARSALAWKTARDIEDALGTKGDFAFPLTMGNLTINWVSLFRAFGRLYDGTPREGLRLVGAFVFRVTYSQLRR